MTLAEALGAATPTYLSCLDDARPLGEEERRLGELFRKADERGRATILAVAEVEGKR
ncbi:MAG: hypothetical protein ACK2T2_07530 [Anaerolineales bacterium]